MRGDEDLIDRGLKDMGSVAFGCASGLSGTAYDGAGGRCRGEFGLEEEYNVSTAPYRGAAELESIDVIASRAGLVVPTISEAACIATKRYGCDARLACLWLGSRRGAGGRCSFGALDKLDTS